jgi:hypothetical protein
MNVKTRSLFSQPVLAEREKATYFDNLPKHPNYPASYYKEREEKN